MGKLLVCLFVTSAVLAAAGTTVLPITSGVADITADGFESFSLHGSGFSYTGAGVNSEFPCGPVVVCIPGGQIPSQFAELSSDDRGIAGTITVGSTTYNYVALPDLATIAQVSFVFDLSTPGTNPPINLTLIGPFTGSAEFEDPTFQSGELFQFDGQGLVTIHLMLGGPPDQQVYSLQHMHFDFAPVPEPGTDTLVFAALAALGSYRMPKRRFSQKRLMRRIGLIQSWFRENRAG